MTYNKVVVWIPHVGYLHYIAPDNIKIRDDVICETRNRDLYGTVVDILENNRKRTVDNKQIKLATESNYKEECNMLRKMFNIVEVSRNDGRGTVYLAATMKLVPGAVVVYSETPFSEFDNAKQNAQVIEDISDCENCKIKSVIPRMHVGLVKRVWERGTFSYKKDINAFVVDTITLDAYYNSIDMVRTVETTKKQLQEKMSQYKERQMYEMMAQTDPEARRLLDMMDTLLGKSNTPKEDK